MDETSAERPFTVADAMILVAALALGLYGMRATGFDGNLALTGTERGWSMIVHGPVSDLPRWLLRPAVACKEMTQHGTPVTAGLSAALLLIRLRRPRPTWRELREQPGFLCSAVATGVFVLALAWAIARQRVQPISILLMPLPSTYRGDWPGLGILGLWSGLRVSGHWQPHRSWIDCLGRAMGLLWLFITAADLLLAILTGGIIWTS